MKRWPKYVHSYVSRGKRRFYFRREGLAKNIRLPDDPDSKEFALEYSAALAGQFTDLNPTRNAPGTVSAAIMAYYNDLSFKTLGEQTRKSRRAVLENFRAEHGDKRFAQLQSSHLAIILGSKKPQAARFWRKTLRGLMKFAKQCGLRKDDPTLGVVFQPTRSEGIATWTEDEIAKFETAYPIGTRERLAFALLLYTAQRRSDVLTMGRQHLEGGSIRVKQQKTRAELLIPIHSELRVILDATPVINLTFLVTERGNPFSAAGFGIRFRQWCNKAGLPRHCSAHGLRKAACRRLAEAGCTEKEIAAISGHASLSEVARYTKAASQVRLAQRAVGKLTGANQEQELANADPVSQNAVKNSNK